MKRILIALLKPATTLEGPLYDRDGALLLREGNVLTAEMIEALNHSDMKYVYMGEWDADFVARSETAAPIVEYRERAESMSSQLEFALVKSLSNHELNVEPKTPAFERMVNNDLCTERTEVTFEQCRNVCTKGEALTQDVVEGLIDPSDVSEAARDVVTDLVDLFATDRSLLTTLTNLKGSDDYLYRHTLNTSILSINIASALQYNRDQILEIGMAALLQDLGMALVPPMLVSKPRALTPEEFAAIEKHVVHTLFAMNEMPNLPYSARVVAYQCHERCDGSGYPQRRSKPLIHRYAQIVGVADVYDSLTSDRPWRRAHHPYEAMEFLIRQANQGKFDAEIVRGLLRYLSLYPLGTMVKLSTGEIAKVVHANIDDFDRPIVSLLANGEDTESDTAHILDLKQADSVKILSFVNGTDTSRPFRGFR